MNRLLKKLPSYRAVLFDMDGVLIDSEPFWREAQIEIFATLGKRFTEEDCAETMGLRIDEVVSYRVPEADQAGVVQSIVDRMVHLITEKGKPLAGVVETLEHLKSLGVPCGLATSSRYRLIEATLECLELRDAFAVLHSAEEEEHGKPHPAVYMTAARKLGYAPEECLAVEDSVNGVIAAKAARMAVVAAPEAAVFDDPRFALADLKVRRLDQALPQLEAAFIHA